MWKCAVLPEHPLGAGSGAFSNHDPCLRHLQDQEHLIAFMRDAKVQIDTLRPLRITRRQQANC